MADFLPCYEKTIRDEGGYKLTNVAGDKGGITYAGISRVMNPQWEGWAYIDCGETPPSDMVRSFYRAGWWDPIQGDAITDQKVASAIFNFGINSSAYGRPAAAVKLAQIVVGATPDGSFGPKTLEAVNTFNPELFVAYYAIARIARRVETCKRDRTQDKFLLGWVDRDLRSLV